MKTGVEAGSNMTASNLAICLSRGAKIPDNRSVTYCMPASRTIFRSLGM
jgi:hypothetical protein